MLHAHEEAECEAPLGSRDSSPVAGEGRRLGGSSHNGLSSAYTVGQGPHVGVGGSETGEESQDRDLLAENGSPARLIGPVMHDELPPYEDEGVAMDYTLPNAVNTWEEPGWGFSRLPSSQRVPAPSEEDVMFGDKGSSNDSTRVEGNAESPTHSLLALDDVDAMNEPIYSEPIMHDDYGSRTMRESAPPPEVPDLVNDDEDEPPVMELQADPANNDELTFNPASK